MAAYSDTTKLNLTQFSLHYPLRLSSIPLPEEYLSKSYTEIVCQLIVAVLPFNIIVCD